MLAGHLAEFVTEIFRTVLASQSFSLTDEKKIHLLGINYWVWPVYQEMLHAVLGHNVSVQG